MQVTGLREADARALLDAVLTAPLDERVRDQLVAETGGNPLALLELPRGLGVHELAGGFALPGAAPLSAAVEESFRRAVQALPEQTRRLLLLAAAEPLGDPGLLWRAAARLGIGADAAAPATAAGLAQFGVRVRFRHPLARSAVYQSASVREKQLVHQALAEVTDPQRDPDRRAWHRAQATEGPDEDVAAELERSADRAQARGGMAAAAAFLERATMLTLEPGPTGRAGAGRRVRQGASGCLRRGCWICSSWPKARAAQRSPGGSRRPDPGPAGLRHRPRQRRPAAAAQSRPTARADRHSAVPRDLPRRIGGGVVRRPISLRLRAPGGGPRGADVAEAADSTSVRPSSRRLRRPISPTVTRRACQFCAARSAPHVTLRRPTMRCTALSPSPRHISGTTKAGICSRHAT